MAKIPLGCEPVVGSPTPSRKREYRVTNRLQEGKRPIYSIVFNFMDSRYGIPMPRRWNNWCTAVLHRRRYQKDESFYTVSWACNIDGTPFLVAGGLNGIIRVIDTGSEKIYKSFVGHGDSINEIKTQPLKPSLVLSASKDESVRLWNIHTGICILIFAGSGGHRNEVLSVDFHPSDIDCFILWLDCDQPEWKKLSISLKSEYPKYTRLLDKILEGLLSQNNVDDKIHHYEEIVGAADEVIKSVDKDELAKYFSLKSDPEDEGAEKLKKKMETTRDQFAEALYQKGLALAEIESLKDEKVSENEDYVQVASDSTTVHPPDLFEENFKELKQWVDIKSSKYGTLFVIHERRKGRLRNALKVLSDMIQEDGQPPKKKFYELKLSLLEQIGWGHLVTYEKQWMNVRFPASLPLF